MQRKGAKERCKRMQFIAPPTEKMFHEKGKNVSRSVAMFHGKARNVLDFLTEKDEIRGKLGRSPFPFSSSSRLPKREEMSLDSKEARVNL